MKKYKHYIVLISIFAITIIGCAYALKWHAVYKENKLNAAVIADYIHELKQEEFSNYISDNPFAVIYFGIPSDSNCRTFEGEFKDLKTKAYEYFVQIFADRYGKEEAERVAHGALGLIEPLSRKQDEKVKQAIEELTK
jgi:hypothetical protein